MFTPFKIEIDAEHAVVVRDEDDGHTLLRLHRNQAESLGWKLVDVVEMLPNVAVDGAAVDRAISAT